MTHAKIFGIVIAALLGYAGFQAGSASDNLIVAQAQVQACPTPECTTTFELPPSSSLFL